MPLYSAEALVLRTYRLGEADRIVVFLTRDRGKKRGVAKGARRSRSRFAAALEPLTGCTWRTSSASSASWSA
jgi:DNA repair protein RecO (recombination protein O)